MGAEGNSGNCNCEPAPSLSLLFSYVVQRYKSQGSEFVLCHELTQLWRKMSRTENLEKHE